MQAIRGQRVAPTPRNEGLTSALRTAFTPAKDSVEREFASLLARLD